MSNNAPPDPEALSQALCDTLKSLIQDPYPHVPNPEKCKKRASVALILRVRPHFNHWPSESHPPDASLSGAESIDKFFEQSWVQHGEPEVVFIKRAARVGDRWTSHVALPGGKRDPEDEDDKAVAIRETVEEIGLDLTSPNALFVGNLPERVVSTSWGKVP
jgi:8-oxo-dGTP pyrophosphatase MutT (NUDIX family)